MEPKVLARAGAVIFVALMIAAAWIELSRTAAHPQQPDATSQPASGTSLREDLLRCAELGEAALRDDDCQKTWAESRNRFLHGKPADLPTPGDTKGPIVPGVSQLSSGSASARSLP
ncbi:MAG: putative entry exclusion protein TrbK-alt [Devosia sp.]|nr:putative entry exclusion protein TrbK-alt [Devosia sp.]